MLSEFAWDQRYKVSSIEDVLTPALVMYPEIIASNLERTVELLGGVSGSLARAHQDGQDGPHRAHAGRARHPHFQVRDHAGTAGGPPVRRGIRAPDYNLCRTLRPAATILCVAGDPTPVIPSLTNAGLIFRFSTEARSSYFRAFLRSDGNTKSVSAAYRLWAFHSSRAFLSAAAELHPHY
jgi:hypothetical protein